AIAIIIRSKSIIKLYRVHAFKYVSFGFHAAKLQFIFELVRLIRLYLSRNFGNPSTKRHSMETEEKQSRHAPTEASSHSGKRNCSIKISGGKKTPRHLI
ncbi:MAG: hypothetical protein IJ775_07315, partial [Muribaculaceae bacterium]|nr:hypothetical protein [Muribaculaceae bacterium]